MFGIPLFELFGYSASIIIAASLMMTSIIKLRLVNLTGAVLFVIYGLVIKAYPVALLNFLISVINIFQLIKLFMEKEKFIILPIEKKSAYFKLFIDYLSRTIR